MLYSNRAQVTSNTHDRSTHSVMVIIIRNEHTKPNSNSGQGSLHFT